MQEKPTLEALQSLIEEGDNIKVEHMKGFSDEWGSFPAGGAAFPGGGAAYQAVGRRLCLLLAPASGGGFSVPCAGFPKTHSRALASGRRAQPT